MSITQLKIYGNPVFSGLNHTFIHSRSVNFSFSQNLFLSALEYRLLLFFINNRGIVLTRERLLDAIWDVAGEYVNDNTLTVYIKRLREKIEDDPADPKIILTVRGTGYKVDA